MFKLKVYYEDTDSGGVVYYANYLKYLERARTQMLLDNGYTHTFLKDKFNIIFIVKSCEIEFIKPAKLDYNLEIFSSIFKKSIIQIYFDQNIYYQKILIAKAKIRVASIDNSGKISKMPLELFNVF